MNPADLDDDALTDIDRLGINFARRLRQSLTDDGVRQWITSALEEFERWEDSLDVYI